MTATALKPFTAPRRASRVLPALVLAAAGALSALSPLAAAGQGSADVGGLWYDDTGEGALEFKPCGQRLCAYIVWLKDPISERTGKPKADLYNPDASKRSRPICGLQILGDLARQSDGTWDEGWVYDPKAGKSYDAAVELDGRNKLTMTGYKGVRFLGKSFTWTRAPDNLPRCQTSSAN